VKDTELRKKQAERLKAQRMLPIIEEEIKTLRKKKTIFKGHGKSTVQLCEQIKQKQSQARRYRKILKEKIHKSAFNLPATKNRKDVLHTKEAEQRPLQGGKFSPK